MATTATALNEDRHIASRLRLQEGEVILFALRRTGWPMLVAKVLTLGIFTFWWRVCWIIVTNQRVCVRQGLLNRSEDNLPMRFIQDAAVFVSWLQIGRVVVTTAGGPVGEAAFYPLKPADARELSDAVLRQARSAWPTS
jgi:membrane protein YdbS with pleckstrin-like domain